MPRYPDLDPLTEDKLKQIARMRDSDGYLINGWYESFDAYCIGEFQRSANTINKRLKRAGFSSKRTRKIEKKKATAEWITAKYKATKSGASPTESVSPSVSPNTSSVSPLPSNNSSNGLKQKNEIVTGDKLTNVYTGPMETHHTKPSKSKATEIPSISSGEAKKTQAELDVEFERLWNS